jgi:hypothetical protein
VDVHGKGKGKGNGNGNGKCNMTVIVQFFVR